MTTGNAAFAHINLFDSATVAARSEAASTPASNLKVPAVSTKWRGVLGDTEYITATFATTQSADTFVVVGLGSTFLATGTARLRLSNVSLGGTDIYDSGVIAGKVDPKYGYLIFLLPQVYSGWKYAYIDLVQTGATFIEAGRVFIGTRTQMTYNYAPGAQLGWVDLSKWTEAAGGGIFIDARNSYREWDVTFSWVSEAQFLSLVEPMDILNGIRTDVFFCRDTANANLGLVSLWGPLRTLSPTLQPFTLGDLYSRSYRIRERRA